MPSPTRLLGVTALSTFIACLVVACGSARDRFTAGPGADGGAGSTPAFNDGSTACVGLACKRATCPSGQTTTLKGKVYDPAGANALYNVVVYIPGGPDGDAPLPPIKSSLEDGVSCDRCAALALDPMVSALTDTKGEFVLKDVPVADEVPLVIQIGKWRRKVVVPVTSSCRENTVPDRSLHLPRNGSEGDMPHIAVTAGGCDALECLLRGIGIDDKEFVPGADPSGHVHLFLGEGGESLAGTPRAGGTSASPSGGALWNSAAELRKYDVTMLSCECGEHNENKGGEPGAPGARAAMVDYANAGGRVFATHFHYTWFKNSPEPSWKSVATWAADNVNMTSGTHDVDMSFPKGQAFADWLVSTGASSTPGKIELKNVMESITSVKSPSQSWIEKSSSAVRYFSFNTPTAAPEADQCGRAVFSDLHVMGNGAVDFPSNCPAAGSLTAQQKAVEFLFFDLSACVQSDSTPPTPPR